MHYSIPSDSFEYTSSWHYADDVAEQREMIGKIKKQPFIHGTPLSLLDPNSQSRKRSRESSEDIDDQDAFPNIRQWTSSAAIEAVINGVCSSEDNAVMLRTIFAIENIIKKLDPTQFPLYVKRKVDSVQKRVHHAFFISMKGPIFIIPHKAKIGEGSVKRVSEAINLLDPQNRYVRAKISLQGDMTDQIVYQEATQLEEMHRKDGRSLEGVDHVIPHYEAIHKTHKCWVLFQKHCGIHAGELYKLSFDDIATVAIDIAKGLMYLHDREKMHCDIKPENIFVKHTPGEKPKIHGIIGDFGFMNDSGKVIKGYTPFYAPPEANLERGASCSFDCFSLGVTLWHFLFGEVPESVPFGRMQQSTIDRQIDKKIVKMTQDIPLNPEEIKKRLEMLSVIQGLLRLLPQERISAADAATKLASLLT